MRPAHAACALCAPPHRRALTPYSQRLLSCFAQVSSTVTCMYDVERRRSTVPTTRSSSTITFETGSGTGLGSGRPRGARRTRRVDGMCGEGVAAAACGQCEVESSPALNPKPVDPSFHQAVSPLLVSFGARNRTRLIAAGCTHCISLQVWPAGVGVNIVIIV